MRLYEYEAKKVLAGGGLKVPKPYGLVRSGKDLPKLRAGVAFPAMVKAQVLVGGRGKAGGVRKVGSAAEFKTAAREMLGLCIKDYRVESVLVEEAVEFTGACYLGITVNPATGNSVLMASAAGGVDIEEVAASRPEAILRLELAANPDDLPAGKARELAAFLNKDLGGDAKLEKALVETAGRLYALYQKHDCKVTEVNPLLITASGPLCADAKMVLDDNGLFRQGALLARLGAAGKRHDVAEPTERERRAAKAGFPYVDLLPESAAREPGKVYVGLVPGGAGYGIFSIDEVAGTSEEFFDGRAVPVNFMDSGGGPSRAQVAEMFALLMDHPLVDLIVTSRFGGISSCDIFVRGLIDCLRERRAAARRVVPVYGRMVGTELAAARAYLDDARRQTPEDLEPLSMIIGNREIMAEVIRKGLADFLARRGT